MYERAWLQGIGFRFYFLNGIAVQITIPVWMSGAFPEDTHKFFFPGAPGSAREANAAALWSMLVDHLGKQIGNYLHWIYDQGFFDGDQAVDIVKPFVRSLVNLPGDWRFQCQDCRLYFVSSAYTRIDGKCADCACRVAEPF